jgi:hypothetical protein
MIVKFPRMLARYLIDRDISDHIFEILDGSKLAIGPALSLAGALTD